MTRQTILISGAGIAGPALAFWLHRHGMSATVVEQAPAPRPGGQTVDLRGAGRVVVERMGLLAQARALALEQRGIAFVDAADRVRARMTTEQFGGEGIVSDLEILRGDLADLLYGDTTDDVEYVFGDTITGLHQDANGVDVTFAQGPPRRFDLVVGADGLHSVVRALAFAPEATAVSPLDCYTAWFTAARHRELDGWYLMYNAPGGRVASMRPGRLPGELKAGLSFRSPPQGYERLPVAEQLEVLATRFHGVGWDVPRLLDAARAADDFVLDAVAQVHVDRLAAGRVVLVGDAGCCPSPLTGLGTSLALVGAYLLAGELADRSPYGWSDGDPAPALARFEQRLRPYVATAQALPPGGVAGYAPSSRLAIAARNASMRSMSRWPMRALLARQFAKSSDVDLPLYAPVSHGQGGHG
jgi:2-polyprenyl-6-methoxyphenol hydroxylase-like FAD-dependent oxidoreductase